MKVLLTGATGFTGSHVVSKLLAKGIAVRCFVRPTSSQVSLLRGDGLEICLGDLNVQATLEKALQGVDTLVNVASLGFGHAPNIVAATVKSRVKRAVFVSTTAIFTSLNAGSKSVRLAAEQTVETSELSYTILRPTMIYGSQRDRNMCRLIRYVQNVPVLPIFGPGTYLQQPIYVGDVAQAIVDVLHKPQTERKAYNIAGAEALTYNQVIDTVARLMKRRVLKLHLPLGPTLFSLRILERLSPRVPIKVEQVLRLNEDKDFDYSSAAEDFGFIPRSFEEGIKLELQEMGILP